MLGGTNASSANAMPSQRVKKKRLRKSAAGAAPDSSAKAAPVAAASTKKTPPASPQQKPGTKASVPKGPSRDPKDPWGTKPKQSATDAATDDDIKPSLPWQELWRLRDLAFTQPTTTTKQLAAPLGLHLIHI